MAITRNGSVDASEVDHTMSRARVIRLEVLKLRTQLSDDTSNHAEVQQSLVLLDEMLQELSSLLKTLGETDQAN